MTASDPAVPEPVVGVYGLRTFRITEDGDLDCVVVRTTENEWPGGACIARCAVVDRHTPPVDDCNCGVYSFRSLHAVTKEYPQGGYVLAVVALEGETIEGSRGWRSRAARVVALWVSDELPYRAVAGLKRKLRFVTFYTDPVAMVGAYPGLSVEEPDPEPSAPQDAHTAGTGGLALRFCGWLAFAWEAWLDRWDDFTASPAGWHLRNMLMLAVKFAALVATFESYRLVPAPHHGARASFGSDYLGWWHQAAVISADHVMAAAAFLGSLSLLTGLAALSSSGGRAATAWRRAASAVRDSGVWIAAAATVPVIDGRGVAHPVATAVTLAVIGATWGGTHALALRAWGRDWSYTTTNNWHRQWGRVIVPAFHQRDDS